jgi:hypothetical protein
MAEDQVKSQEFKCLEPSCNEKVVFKYTIIIGTTKAFGGRGEREEEAYLTCPNNHTHKYRVKIPKQ